MKKLKLLKFGPHLLFGALAVLFIMSTTNAAEGLVRVSKSQYSNTMKARGLETYRGEVIGLREIEGSKEVGEVLASPSIETKKGDIYYPEEIEFILIKSNLKDRGADERAPHGDERIPHGDE